jgi:hypothetical protein
VIPLIIRRSTEKEEFMSVRFEERELATVLAALRYWQQDLEDNEYGPISLDHFDATITPLTVAEIDKLCERLNAGAKKP